MIKKISDRLGLFIVYLLGCTALQLLAPFISAFIAIAFAFSYLQVLQIYLTDQDWQVAFYIFIILFSAHALQAGLLHKFGITGLSRSMNLVNKYIHSNKKKYSITDNLNKTIYLDLLLAIKRIPLVNTFMSLQYLFIHGIIVIIYLYTTRGEELFNILLKLALVYILAGIIYSMFVNIITLLLNRNLIIECKKKIQKLKIPYKDKPNSTFKIKLIYLIIIFTVGLFISTSILYLEKSNFQFVFLFNGFVIITSVIMIILVFNIIATSLEEINHAISDLKGGGEGSVFLSSIDKEFIDLGSGVEDAAITINDYKNNLEQKVDQRTLELTEVLKNLEEKNKIIEQEFSLAKKIQEGIIPQDIYKWEGIEISSFWKSLMPISGDYFDIIKSHDDNLTIVMCDVSGHGIPAALITTMAKVSFSTISQQTSVPSEILLQVNQDLCNAISTFDYLTSFCISISKDKVLSYSNAGHPFPLYYNSQKKDLQELESYGHIIGVFQDEVEYATSKVQIHSGDKILLYTDGLTESTNKQGESFESHIKKLFLDNIQMSKKDLIHKIESEFYSFTNGVLIKDDVSFMLVEFD